MRAWVLSLILALGIAAGLTAVNVQGGTLESAGPVDVVQVQSQDSIRPSKLASGLDENKGTQFISYVSRANWETETSPRVRDSAAEEKEALLDFWKYY